MFLKKYCIGFLMGLLLTACTDPVMRSADEHLDGDCIQVTFTLALGEQPAYTRAGQWEDGTYQPAEVGDSYDNRIDPAQLQVLVYGTASGTGATSSADACLGEVKNLALIPTAQPNVYQFIGSLEVEKLHLTEGRLHARLAVFANWGKEGKVSANQSLTELASITYPYDAPYIPMWGVKTIDVSLTPGQRTDIGAIYLLRALAKIQLRLNEKTTAAGYRIQSATLSHYHTSGCCLPTGYDKVEDTQLLDLDDVLHLPTSVATQEKLSFTDQVLYVPEYAHTGQEAFIDVILQKEGTGETVTGKVRFVDYQDGQPVATATPYALVRNHLYRYTLGVADEKLQVVYVVNAWDEVHSSDIEWNDPEKMQFQFKGWNNDEDKDSKKGDEEARYCYVTRPAYKSGSTTILKSGSGSASFSFKLTSPKGVSWKAHLSDTENFEFSSGTYTVGGKKYHKVASGVAREQRYQIQINAKNSWTNPVNSEDGNETEQDLDENPTLLDTDWGKQWVPWGETPHPFTYFSITVSTEGAIDIPLVINPEVEKNSGKANYQHTFTENGVQKTVYREYAGTATEIYIRQVKITGKNLGSINLAYNQGDTDFPYYYADSPLLNK